MLWLTETQARQVVQHAQDEAPAEACGIIAGRGSRALKVLPIPNCAESPHTRYQFDAAAYVRAMFEIQAEGMELIAIYHSHPNGAPLPSQTDLREARYGRTPYLIIGLENGAARLAAWSLHQMRAEPVPLHIGLNPPEHWLEQRLLSRAQMAAIFISAALALVLMLVAATALLPPAPPIP